jgi:DNA topoisomerase-3
MSQELACPLDGYQLLLFSLGGADGKNTVLCPYCYNHPPAFMEGADDGGGGRAGMACAACLHPTCRHSVRLVPAKQAACRLCASV